MSYHATILAEPSLINYYRGEETSGTLAADSQGTLAGTYQSGVVLGGAGLDGDAPSYPGNLSTGYMSVATATGMPTGAASRTLELWFNTTHAQTDGSGFVGLCGYGAGSSGQLFALYFGSDSSAKTLVFGDFGSNLTVTLAIPYNDGNWHHYAAAYDGTTLRLYYDGVLVGTKTVTYATASGTAFYVGRWSSGNGPFNGAVDEVAVYNAALSPDSILAHYLAGPRADVRAKSTPPKPARPRVNPRWASKLISAVPLHDVATSGTPGGKTYDPVLRGYRTITFGSWTAGQDRWGPNLTPANSSGSLINLGFILSGSSAFTLCALCTLTSAAPVLGELWAIEGATGYLRVTIDNAAVGVFFQVNTDGTYTNLVAPPPPLNYPVLITARLTSAGVRSIWYGTNKVAERTDVGAAIPTNTTNALGFGAGGGGSNRQWVGPLSGGLVFGQALTDAEIVELNSDFFAPVRYGRMSDTLMAASMPPPPSITSYGRWSALRPIQLPTADLYDWLD